MTGSHQTFPTCFLGKGKRLLKIAVAEKKTVLTKIEHDLVVKRNKVC